MNQYQKISNFCDKHGSITPMDAFAHLHITKLATRVSEMRRMGYEFTQAMESHTNSEGDTSRYMRYRKVSNP